MNLRLISYGMICFFLFFSIIMNFTELYFPGGATMMIRKYYENDIVRVVYLISVFLQTVIFLNSLTLAVNYRKKANSILILLIQLSSLIILFLVWFELYYGSTFYYGEVRDKQALFYNANALGIFGASVLLTYAFTLMKWFQNKVSNGKIFYAIFSFIIIIGIQYIIYHLLEDKWRLWSS